MRDKRKIPQRKQGEASIKSLAKKIASCVVALSMTVMLTPASAFAYSDDYGAEYYVGSPDSSTWVDETIDGVSGHDYGVGIVTEDGGHATVTVNGAVEGTQDGVNVSSTGEGSLSQITVNGNITGEEDDGIDVAASNGASTKATVTGNVKSGDDAVCASASGSKSNADITVNGNVEADYWGLSVWAGDGGKSTVTVNGNVATTSSHAAIEATAEGGGILDVTVNGDISSAEGDGANIYTESGYYIVDPDTPITPSGEQTVFKFSVKGNVTAAGEGLYFDSEEDDAIIDAFVDGTIKGGAAGVVVDSENKDATDSVIDLTVWKIETREDGVLVANGTYNGDDAAYTADEELAAKIKYIIKVEQPEAGATVSATDAEGNVLDKSHDLDYALEGDKVLLKVDLQPGYKLTGAFNGLGEKAELLMDDAGNYYVVVPRGGGVYLSVETALIDYKVTFVDENGKELTSGTYHYGDMPAYKGETPVKASDDTYDYEFIGWTPELDKVTGDITYKATFKAIEKEKKSEDKELTEKIIATAQAELPQTGDAPYAAFAFGMVLLSGAGVVISSRRRND